MGDSAKPEKINPLAELGSLLDLFNGKNQTTTTGGESSTETTRSNLTPEQLNAQIQMAMAPLNQASRGAGISAYGDTTLALGRGQIAADILAKNAGATRTVQSSGRTSTTKASAPFSPDNFLNSALTLGVAQVGLPLIKKIGTKTGFNDWLDTTTESVSDSVASSISDFFTPDSSISIGGDTSIVGDWSNSIAESAISDSSFVSDLVDSGSSFVSDVTDFFGFADGGVVNYLDRFTPNTNVADVSKIKTIAEANGSAVSSSESVTSDPTNITRGRGKSEASLGVEGSVGNINSRTIGNIVGGFVPGVKAYNAIATLTGLMPTTGDVVSNIMAAQFPNQMMTPAQQAIAADFKAGMNGPGTGATGLAAQDSATRAALRSNEGYGGRDSGTDSGGSAAGAAARGGMGFGGTGSGVGGDGAAYGGNIKGPGTGTSDSIKLNVSNGERVITAKTNQAIEDMYPGFFHMLEQEFNPQAAVAQVMKGRV